MMNQNRLTQKENHISNMVRTTLQAATQPAPGQLQRLMPPPPPRSRSSRFRFLPVLTWQQQWAAAAICFCLVLGSLGFYLGYPAAGGNDGAAPTFLAITATITEEPTATVAHEYEERPLAATAVATLPAAVPVLSATPAPNPTPIAALVPIVSSN